MEKLNITATVLDKLGFSEYWDENGTWGGRTLEFSNGAKFRIMEIVETDDETEGYGEKMYKAQKWCFADWFATPKIENGGYYDLFFLHEMYECIKHHYPDCLEEFASKCKSLGMKWYIPQ